MNPITLTAQWVVKCLTGVTCETVDLAINGVKNYDYSGSTKGAIINKNGYYKLETWGASGEERGYTTTHTHTRGGYTYGTINITESTIFYINVGGAPSSYYIGGWNGGGDGDGKDTPAGGGGTDIRILSNSLFARVIVAGGGGGCRQGGNGNDSCDISNLSYGNSNDAGDNKRNATLYAPGTPYIHASVGTFYAYFGIGGGGLNDGIDKGGGGGGGWYGGGSDDAGCGGGSGWVYTTANYNTWSSRNNSDATQYLLGSEYHLLNSGIIRGNTSFKDPNGSNTIGHNGNGYARITYLGTSI